MRLTTTLVSRATTRGSLLDAGFHLLDRRNPGGPGWASCKEIFWFTEDRGENQPALVVDTNIDQATGPQLELLAKLAGDREPPLAAHRQGGHYPQV